VWSRLFPRWYFVLTYQSLKQSCNFAKHELFSPGRHALLKPCCISLSQRCYHFPHTNPTTTTTKETNAPTTTSPQHQITTPPTTTMAGETPNHVHYTINYDGTTQAAKENAATLETILRNPQIAERSPTGQALQTARYRVLYPINPDPSGERAKLWAAAEAQWASQKEEMLQVQRQLRWAEQHRLLRKLCDVDFVVDDGRL
jgi:hypothetical protein